MGKASCCTGHGLRKGSWTSEEDQKLKAYIDAHGEGNWRSLPAKAGLQRCGKSCRLRWMNYLRPGIKRGSFTALEDQTIIQLHAKLGNRWAAIARQLTKRTDNEIKNYWNSHLKKRLAGMGVEPETPTAEDGGATAEVELETPVQLQTKKPCPSASAQLLNRLATRLTSLPDLYAIKSRLATEWVAPPQRCDSSGSDDSHTCLWLVENSAVSQQTTCEYESDVNANNESWVGQSSETEKQGTEMKNEALNHVVNRLATLSCVRGEVLLSRHDWGLDRDVAEFPEVSDIDMDGLFCDIGSPLSNSSLLVD